MAVAAAAEMGEVVAVVAFNYLTAMTAAWNNPGRQPFSFLSIEMYFIYQFTLINSLRANLLITQSCSVKLNDARMTKLLKQIGDEKASYVSDEFIKLRLESEGISVEDGLDFLRDTGVIELVHDNTEDNFPFISVSLVTDSDDINCLVEGMLNDGIKVNAVSGIEGLTELVPEENSLIVVYLESYSSSIMRRIYKKYSHVGGIAFIQAYYMKDEFKIDGYYSPSIGTPCHFCHIGRWRSREKRSFAKDMTSWNDVIEYLEFQDISVPTTIPLGMTDKHFACHILRRKLQSIAGIPLIRVHLDEFSSSVSANLLRCEITSEPLPHWHSCGCLTGDW